MAHRGSRIRMRITNRRRDLNKQKLVSLAGVGMLVLTSLPAGLGPGASTVALAQTQDVPPDTSAFQAVWDRTDALVATSRVSRTWFWGPQPFWTTRELYVNDPT